MIGRWYGPPGGFFPVIVLFVASLGQTMSRFCHNIRDYTSDEKEGKVRAREMITVVQDVNPRNWSEEWITCYTCHAGEEHPRRFPAGWEAAPIPGRETHEDEHEEDRGEEGEEHGTEHMLKPEHRPEHEHRPHHENE